MSKTFGTVDELAREHGRAGGHFFDADTMRFFGTRVCGSGLLFGGRAFVTSEEVWGDGARSYAVRALPTPGDVREIVTWGERLADRREAVRLAEVLGRLTLAEWETAVVLQSDGLDAWEAVRVARALLCEEVAA